MIERRDRPAVFAKFVAPEILGEWGRLLLWLLRAFSRSGHEIWLFDNLPRDELGKFGPLALELPNFRLTKGVPSDTADMYYLFDDEDRAVGGRRWRKKIQARFDIFASHWFSRPIFVPYPVHPNHAGPDLAERLADCRRLDKKMRVFFSGDTEGYVRSRVRYPSVKMPRLDVINAICRHLGDEVVRVADEDTVEGLFASPGFANKFVLASPDFRIDSSKWLSTVARAEFFLCPPGYVMPMCHNAVEALAVGAIPIISYPEWFDPRLEHLKNCVVFDDEADLVAKMRAVFAMGPEQISRMRSNAIDYYEGYLTDAWFIRRIESSGRRKETVLLITEPYVAARPGKLGWRSILIRGTATRSGC